MRLEVRRSVFACGTASDGYAFRRSALFVNRRGCIDVRCGSPAAKAQLFALVARRPDVIGALLPNGEPAQFHSPRLAGRMPSYLPVSMSPRRKKLLHVLVADTVHVCGIGDGREYRGQEIFVGRDGRLYCGGYVASSELVAAVHHFLPGLRVLADQYRRRASIRLQTAS